MRGLRERSGTGRWALVAVLATFLCVLAAGGAASAAHPLARSCPSPDQLSEVGSLKGALPPARRFAQSHRSGHWQVRELQRAPQSAYASIARSQCGDAVLRKSVYVQLHRREDGACVACDFRGYLAKFRSGGWTIWFLR